MLPNTILQQIFLYLPIPDRLRASRVSRQWHYNCMDAYLYRDVTFQGLEFNKLIEAMKFIIQMNPKLKSISIEDCYSDFIQSTVIPVQFSTQNNRPLLFTHIRALQPLRRRQAYLSHGFELHNLFSDMFSQLLKKNQSTLHTIKITGTDLDFEMTEIFCSIACHSQSLETFHYMNNGDKGLQSSGLLQAIVSGSPKMKHFLGSHEGMDDAVLMTMARHWPSLESLTLCSIKSKDVLELTGLVNENGQELRGVTPTGSISPRAFWELIVKCKHLQYLEIHDLSCFTNRDITLYKSFLDTLQYARPIRYKPYEKRRQNFPGSSLKKLKVAKYITTPLSTPGLQNLLKLFPNLKQFDYSTNFHAFHNQFEGVTMDMFDAERIAVEQFMKSTKLKYVGNWNETITTEQRLMAGMITRSDLIPIS